MRNLRSIALVLCVAAPPIQAQVDTVSHRPYFSWRDAAIIEGFAILAVSAAPLDRELAGRLQNPGLQENQRIRQTAMLVRTVADPGSFLIGAGLYVGGRLTKQKRLADLGLHGTEALFLGGQLGTLLKGLAGRARPYVNVDNPHNYSWGRGFGSRDYRSMPSGHTIAAFAAASAVTSETHRWWPRSTWIVGPVMYGGASLVGWSRMFNNQHWASDVIVGAAVGTFAGLKVVHWHHSHPGNIIDRTLLGPFVAPGADRSTVVGFQLTSPF